MEAKRKKFIIGLIVFGFIIIFGGFFFALSIPKMVEDSEVKQPIQSWVIKIPQKKENKVITNSKLTSQSIRVEKK